MDIKNARNAGIGEKLPPALDATVVSYNIIDGRLPSSFWCVFVGFFTFVVYVSNGDFLPNHDATSNVMLPGQIIAKQALTFGTKDFPYMFVWQLSHESLEKPFFPAIMSLNDTVASDGKGKSFSAWYYLERGALQVVNHRYYVVPCSHVASSFANTFGVGTALTLLPLFLAADIFLGVDIEKPNLELFMLSKLGASLLVSCSVVFLWMTICLYLRKIPALILAISYAIGTIVWPVSSQALYQHAANECFLTLGFFFLCRYSLIARYENIVAESTVSDREKVKMEAEFEQRIADLESTKSEKVDKSSNLTSASLRPNFSVSRQPERAAKEGLGVSKEIPQKKTENAFMPTSLSSRTAIFSSRVILSRFCNFSWNSNAVLSAISFGWAVFCRPTSVVFVSVCFLYLICLSIFAYRRSQFAKSRMNIAMAASSIMGQAGNLAARFNKQKEDKFSFDDEDDSDDETDVKNEGEKETSKSVENLQVPSFKTFSTTTKHLLIAACPSLMALYKESSWRAFRAAIEYLIASLFVGFIFTTINLLHFGDWFMVGQALIGPRIALEKTGSSNVWGTPFLEGLQYLFISPSRGLFIFSPHLCLSVVGILFLIYSMYPLIRYYTEVTSTSAFDSKLYDAMEWVQPVGTKFEDELDKEGARSGIALLQKATYVDYVVSPVVGIEKDWAPFYPMLISMILLVLTASAWFDPYGGWTYGPRPIVDLMSFFTILLVPVTQFVVVHISQWTSNAIPESKADAKDKPKSREAETGPVRSSSSFKFLSVATILLFFAGLAFAVWVQFIGAFSYNQEDWNSRKCFELKCKIDDKTNTTSLFYFDLEEAKQNFNSNCEVLQTGCDIDNKLHRHRLWSWTDNIIQFYWENFAASRAAKKSMIETWHKDLAK